MKFRGPFFWKGSSSFPAKNRKKPISSRVKFLDWLASGESFLADGAMGAQLHARGIPFDTCFDELNLSQPDLILDIHRGYLEAGAKIIETNTSGANHHKLSSLGLEDQVAEINAAGVTLAKLAIEETGADALLAGSVGPLGLGRAPFGRVKPEEANEAFKEQYGPLGIPVLVGILPLHGISHARFLHNEVPGISIPEAIQKRVSAVGDRAPQAGVSIAVEVLDQLKNTASGAYLVPPFNRYDMAAEIIESVAERMPAGGGA